MKYPAYSQSEIFLYRTAGFRVVVSLPFYVLYKRCACLVVLARAMICYLTVFTKILIRTPMVSPTLS